MATITMSPATVGDTSQAGTSLQKQLIYTKYAHGELSLDEVSHLIAQIRPPQQRMPPAYRIAKVLVFILSALILPTWATRHNDD